VLLTQLGMTCTVVIPVRLSLPHTAGSLVGALELLHPQVTTVFLGAEGMCR
jgi:hypothetical protein